MGVPNRGAVVHIRLQLLVIFDQHLTISQKQCKTGTWYTNRTSYALYRMLLFPVTLSDP